MKLLFEKSPYIHRKELFSAYTTVTHYKCRFRAELISKLIKSFRILFCITLYLDGNDCSLLAKNKINLVGKFTPIEHFNTMNKRLTDNPSTYPRFKDAPPLLAIHNSLIERMRIIHHL